MSGLEDTNKKEEEPVDVYSDEVCLSALDLRRGPGFVWTAFG